MKDLEEVPVEVVVVEATEEEVVVELHILHMRLARMVLAVQT